MWPQARWATWSPHALRTRLQDFRPSGNASIALRLFSTAVSLDARARVTGLLGSLRRRRVENSGPKSGPPAPHAPAKMDALQGDLA